VYRRSDALQEVRWDKGGTERAEDYTFFYGAANEDHQLGTGFFFLHKRIISAVRRAEFVSDRMSYLILRDHWCNIIVVNVHAPCVVTSDDVKDGFYEELGRVFDQFPRYDMKILFGDFNAKVGKEDIFKPTIGNESSHEISNDNGVRVLTLPHLRTYLLKAPCSPIAAFINTSGPLLMERRTIRSITFL
jgi:hypothetical protein